jgi:hypothetical protein
MKRLAKAFNAQDFAILAGLAGIAGGLAAFDWRLSLVVTGSLILGLTVWGIKSGNSNQPGSS